MISIFFFLIFFPSATSLSFNFSSFGSNNHNISFDEAGDAVYSSDGCIQLTRNENDKQSNDSWGRAMYSERLYLWDQTSRNLTDFTSNFSFVINSQGSSQHADGLTFFLNGTQLHTDTLGGTLGLANEKNETNKSAVTFIAVEFDTFTNAAKKDPEEEEYWGDQEDGADSDLAMDEDFEKGTGPRKFSFNELALATIKRVTRNSQQGMKEYASEVKIFCRLRHRNLVRLMGWCHQKGELLLVYELLPNGSLSTCLFEEKTLLTWAMRYRIALGLASSLLYLHEEWEQCVVHRDIKSSNVMLDSDFNAKLGDFGLARLVDHGKASKESDVYSFGIVVLEICCGRRAVETKAEENQIRLVEWVWDLYGVGKLLEAADPRLSADYDDQQMERLMIVGLWCAHPDCQCSSFNEASN
ncbi:L-type lectin-domain containing receptor kinase IX.1 [Vitis vinifera]|uniref:non-specific serine/threonine protein kinase n=1 Tax=Vitis vinifera TaxID=29760 RepID=A0A438GU90_VITVI|nr:L-type lectin-domain containing receptor kinase IX.1 [Vitis vinifera]